MEEHIKVTAYLRHLHLNSLSKERVWETERGRGDGEGEKEIETKGKKEGKNDLRKRGISL